MPDTPETPTTLTVLSAPDEGWRKAIVTLGGLAAVVALAIAGRIAGQEALYAVGGLVGAYLGINMWSRRR